MKLKRRTVLAGVLPGSLRPAFATALSAAAASAFAQPIGTPPAQDSLARVLYLLAPLPAFAAADYEAASLALLQRTTTLPALKLHVEALLARLNAAGFLALPLASQLAFLKSVQTTPEFRFVSNPAFGVFNHKPVWPRVGYEGASFHLGGYRNRGFDDINWLFAAVKKGA
jgi:hypothetical protein